MTSLQVLSEALVQKCYPSVFRVEGADQRFTYQEKKFCSNLTLVHDVLKQIHLATIKRMVRCDIKTLFYRDMRWTDMRGAFAHLLERSWILRNWPKDCPLPTNTTEHLTDRRQASKILLGIWTGVISLSKATLGERQINAIIELDNGEYHCHHVASPKASQTPASNTPDEQAPSHADDVVPPPAPSTTPSNTSTARTSNRATDVKPNIADNANVNTGTPSNSTATPSANTDIAVRPTPTAIPDAPPSQEPPTAAPTKKRKRSQTTKTESSPTPTRAKSVVVDLCSPPAKRQKRQPVTVKREESPEIQVLSVLPMTTNNRSRGASVSPSAHQAAGKTERSRAKTPGPDTTRTATEDPFADEQALRARAWHRKKFIKAAVNHAFEQSCIESINIDRCKDPVGWMREMIRRADAVKRDI